MRGDFTRRQFLGSTGMGLVALGYGAGPAVAADETSTPKRFAGEVEIKMYRDRRRHRSGYFAR